MRESEEGRMCAGWSCSENGTSTSTVRLVGVSCSLMTGSCSRLTLAVAL